MAVETKAGIKLDHLSWSSVNCYVNICPKQFYFRKVVKAPEERVSAALVFGSAIHSACEAVHEARLMGRTLPSVEELGHAFDAEWNERSKAGPAVEFSAKEDEVGLKALGRRMLSAYREYSIEREKVGVTVVGIEEAQRFPIIEGAPPMEARIDLIELDGTDLVVSDLKTSRSRWNEQKASDGLPQLVTYAHGVRDMVQALAAKKVVPRFVVLTKAKSPVVQVCEPKATSKDAERLRDLVRGTWDGIQRGVFHRREGWWCRSCAYAVRCLGRE